MKQYLLYIKLGFVTLLGLAFAYYKNKSRNLEMEIVKGKNERLGKVILKQTEANLNLIETRKKNQEKLDALQKSIDAGNDIDLH